MASKKRLNLFIVSDGTGATAESVLTSVLVQYRGAEFNIQRFPFTRTKREVEAIVEQAPKGKCIIVFTLVSADLREFLIEQGKAKHITVVDVMGPLIQLLSGILHRSPKMKPGVFRHQEEEMFRTVEAIHFTLLHDDGMGIETINEADLIILGVSRTGKTPTSIYLSCRKLKVANIPIIEGVPFPREVSRLPIKKVGFRIDPDRLSQLRSERGRRLSGMGVSHYSSKAYILQEEEYCENVYRKIPSLWTIDVTTRTIEEISEWITHNVL
jgi:regulator of PEP synthase PpsR (kinase-PPPase family)